MLLNVHIPQLQFHPNSNHQGKRVLHIIFEEPEEAQAEDLQHTKLVSVGGMNLEQKAVRNLVKLIGNNPTPALLKCRLVNEP